MKPFQASPFASLAAVAVIATCSALVATETVSSGPLPKPTPTPTRAGADARHFDNTVLHVEVTGHGRPMLFLPGLASSGDVWRDAVARYADRFECHVVTLGGFAGQPRFDGPFLDTARDSLLAYLRARHLQRPVIVGHSLGGVLALELGVRVGDAVGPLVILDALPFLGGAGRPGATAEGARQAMAPLRDMIRGQTQEAYAAFQRQSPYLRAMVSGDDGYTRVIGWAANSDHAAVADGMFEVGTIDLRDSIAAITAPVLVLGTWYGSRETSTREATEGIFREQFAKVPNCTIALADSARHFLMLDAPDWTWAQVNRFLGTGGSVASDPRRIR